MTTARATKNLNDILVIFAVVSGFLVFFSSVYVSFDSSWQARVFCSFLTLFFDGIFVLELLGRVSGVLKSSLRQRNQRTVEFALLALTSATPFIFISGPFLLSWIHADFNVSAIPGSWASGSELAIMGSIVFLRQLRLVRPFLGLPCPSRHKKIIFFSFAAIIGIGFAVGVLSDSAILPGYRNMLSASRTELAFRLQESTGAETVAIGRANPDILAISVYGNPVFSRAQEPDLKPGCFEYFSAGSVGVWFSLIPEHKIISVSEAVDSGFMVVIFAVFFFLLLHRGKRDEEKNPDSRTHCADLPIGTEELNGILGKTR